MCSQMVERERKRERELEANICTRRATYKKNFMSSTTKPCVIVSMFKLKNQSKYVMELLT